MRNRGDVNAFDESGYTPLHWAVIHGRGDEIRDLIRRGADINARYHFSMTPTHFAVYLGDFNCLKVLVTEGANVNINLSNNRTLLHLCAYFGFSEGLVFLLENSNLDPNAIDNSGCSPLHLAATNGHLNCIENLTQFNAAIHLMDFAGRTALHDAARMNQLAIVRYLIINANLDPTLNDRAGRSPLDMSYGLTRKYLQLHQACKENRNIIEYFNDFIEGSIDNNHNYFAIEAISFNQRTQILKMPQFQTIMMRLKSQYNTFAIDFCRSLLKSKNFEDIKEAIGFFLDETEINNLSGTGENILHIAAEINCPQIIPHCRDSWQIMINQKTEMTGMNPIHIAVAKGNIGFLKAVVNEYPNQYLSLFLEKTSTGSNVLHLSTLKDSEMMVQFLEEVFKDQNSFKELFSADNEENTIIHVCILNRAIKILKYLLLNYHEIKCLVANDCYNRSQDTPQHLAALHDNPDIMELLRMGNADFSVQNKIGNTPLHIACKIGHFSIVHYLIEKIKVNQWQKNQFGDTPAETASRYQKLRIKNFLNSLPYQKIEDGVDNFKNYLWYQRNPIYSNRPNRSIVELDETKALTFMGGGVKGIGFYGALKELYDTKGGQIWFNKIERVAGTSAGGIIALLLSMGYSLEECRVELDSINFEELIEPAHRDFVLALQKKDFSGVLGRNLSSLCKDLLSDQRNGFEKFVSFATRFIPAIKDVKNVTTELVDLFTILNKNFGIFNGQKLLERFEEWIERKTGDRNLTFGDLAEKIKDEQFSSNRLFKHLHVIGLRLNSDNPITIFSSEDKNTKDIVIAHAIRITMAIPIFFTPHCVHIKSNGEAVSVPDRGLYADGGIAKNNPYDLFDNIKYLSSHGFSHVDQHFVNPQVLSFVLQSAKTHHSGEEYTHAGISQNTEQEKIENLFSYLHKVVYGILNVENANFKLEKSNYQRTIFINTGDISATQFDISEEDKRILINSGKEGVVDYNKRKQKKLLTSSPQLLLQVKRIIEPYLVQDMLELFYLCPLEVLYSSTLIMNHGPSLIAKLLSTNLHFDDLQQLLYNFNLNLSCLDDANNNAAHLLALEGDLNALKQLFKLKPILFMMINADQQTPIAVFYDCTQKSIGEQQEEVMEGFKTFIGFCYNSGYSPLKTLIEEKYFELMSYQSNFNLSTEEGTNISALFQLPKFKFYSDQSSKIHGNEY